MKRTMIVFVVGFSFWMSVASLCLGGGRDSALQKALADVFPADSELTPLTPKSRVPRVLEVRAGDALLGYAVELEVVSRSGPFRIMVAVSPEEKVMGVQIPKYPHRRGRGVKKTEFLKQFDGRAYGEQLVLGEQVDGVSGATSSSTAVTTGVRQALILVHRYAKRES